MTKFAGTLKGIRLKEGDEGKRGVQPRVEATGSRRTGNSEGGLCCRAIPRMEPVSFPFLVGESTAATKALSCLKLRSRLSSPPGVESGVPVEDRKKQIGVRGGDRAREAAGRGVEPLSPSGALLGPGLVNLLPMPHLLTDPRRDKMEDLEELEASKGRSVGPWFGEDG